MEFQHIERIERIDTASGVVTHDLVVECDDERGRPRALRTQLGYRVGDPYAVTATFFAAAGPVTWTFARDLLVRGATEPSGLGDVHVWPCLDERGRAVVIIELRSPDGELVMQALTAGVQKFLVQSLALVPLGSEDDHLDLDDLVSRFLAA